MYNRHAINSLVACIEALGGRAEKCKIAQKIQTQFGLVRDRSVYYSSDFAIRFCQSHSTRMSNTVLSLSVLQKYDNNPFFVCIVTPQENCILLANSSFLTKISHSSKDLRVDNIRGSFNGTDIIRNFNGFTNTPENFEKLFAYHCDIPFEDNLIRLVECSNKIVSRGHRFLISETEETRIMKSVETAQRFVRSSFFCDLKDDLDLRVRNVQGEIAIAAFIDNINLRGRVIEFLITNNGSTLKEQIIDSLKTGNPLPKFTTEDNLGDYSKNYPAFHTETDIKTKVLFLSGNPKAYNVDKLLEFLSKENSVYLIYLLGIDDKGSIIPRLCSVFDKRLMQSTNIVHHWAGRSTRGVSQFLGTGLVDILNDDQKTIINSDDAIAFLKVLINR